MLTQEYIKKIISYNPDTGECFWLDRPKSDFIDERAWKIFHSRYAGKKAGSKRQNGYLDIWVLGRLYRIHRIIFLYMTGSMPSSQIDHIDHDRSNNKWNNIRSATAAENRKNMGKNARNTSGFTGVNYHKRLNKWVAEAVCGYKKHYIGVFESFDEAVNARKAFNKDKNFHANHGLAI